MIPSTTVPRTASDPIGVARPVATRAHIAYLDGIRGLSALYVVLFHSALGRDQLPPSLHRLVTWMEHGKSAVAIFIVLSGYLLMLPVARSAEGKLRGGALDYIKRRARRILPPYYAALGMTALLVWIGGALHYPAELLLHPDPIALTPGNLITHLLLIYNLYPYYVTALDYPMWSVALEWQLYFLLPLLLLPLWRRFGITATTLIACLIGLSPLLLWPEHDFQWTPPWYLGLFAMGMSTAVLTESRAQVYRTVFAKVPWLLLSVLCAGLGFLPIRALSSQRFWYGDILIGLAAGGLILHCRRQAEQSSTTRRSLLLHVFESRLALSLGTFSYSLYLIHIPLGWLFEPIYERLNLSGLTLLLFSLGIKIPLFCIAAYGFYLLFEKPFLSQRSLPAKVSG